ncbi:hypothetical protein PMI07_004596 [Rhizobium sp. CF080]|uniref:hypothetical protein n=1 Tax=Rhizobium sp. (strain CF080) TaxID=1144310 RepID=UPI0002715F3E|nr:hypothetical protein [Rhizobium sp. CF080]EUC00134.1 hypothetical protein PMI07_004596 [Rhizobium sp. CF080]
MSALQATQTFAPVAIQTAAPVSAPAVRKPNPSKVRLAVLMVVAVYPIITALLYALAPLTEGWSTWQRTLVIAPIMVSSIVFVVGPNIQKYLGWFVARLPRPVR